MEFKLHHVAKSRNKRLATKKKFECASCSRKLQLVCRFEVRTILHSGLGLRS